MRAIHANFGWAVAAANIVAGVWGLIRHRRKLPPEQAFWIALGIAWGTVLVQGIMGLALFQQYRPPFKHTFYGFLFVVVMLFVWPLRSDNPRTAQLVFSIASLFIGIVAVRAVFSL